MRKRITKLQKKIHNLCIYSNILIYYIEEADPKGSASLISYFRAGIEAMTDLLISFSFTSSTFMTFLS